MVHNKIAKFRIVNSRNITIFFSTVIGESGKESSSFLYAVGHFFTMFIGSAAIGTLFALFSALVSFEQVVIGAAAHPLSLHDEDALWCRRGASHLIFQVGVCMRARAYYGRQFTKYIWLTMWFSCNTHNNPQNLLILQLNDFILLLTFVQLLKHINLRRIPSLELAFILIFSYAPYGLAEGLGLSGMRILFLKSSCVS